MNRKSAEALEAILFAKGEPVAKKELAKLLTAEEAEVDALAAELAERLSGRGIQLIRTDRELSLGTDPDAHELMRELHETEVSGPLSKAAIETLAIILYRGPASKPEIDFIRGVNSQFILRNLLIRGLVTKEQDRSDARKNLFAPSVELLEFLGITRKEDMPEYQVLREKVEHIIQEQSNDEDNERAPVGS